MMKKKNNDIQATQTTNIAAGYGAEKTQGEYGVKVALAKLSELDEEQSLEFLKNIFQTASDHKLLISL